jgi:hypothetical protein
MAEIYLAELPTDHPLRNTSLSQIDAMYQTRGSKAWHSIHVLGGIKKHITYNQLGEVWTKWDLWKAGE